MSSPPDAIARLHETLRSFYNTDPSYWVEEQQANAVLTPEREHLFGWIRSGDRVLDVGCGTCRNGVALGDRVTYVGCDISFRALSIASADLDEASARLTQGESHALPFISSSFDVVLSTYALEHFVYPQQTLDEMWRVCRPGGRVILISPSYDDPRVLPPSTSHWSAGHRYGLIARQGWRQMVRHLNPRRYYFARVERPRILSDAYVSDFDAVHLVSAREIANYFRAAGGEILFERKRAPRPVEGRSPLRRCRERARNLLLRMHLGEYARMNLQIVVAKPEES